MVLATDLISLVHLTFYKDLVPPPILHMIYLSPLEHFSFDI